MNANALGILAILAYTASTIGIVRSLRLDYRSSKALSGLRLGILLLAWLAVILHAGQVVSSVLADVGLDFGLLNALSLVSWVAVLILLLAAFFKPVDKLGIVIYPLSALILTLKLSIPAASHTLHTHSWPMNAHILSSMLAFSLLNIAAMQALLLAVQDWGLRTHQAASPLIRSLPPLQTMESLLFQLIAAGFVLLTLSLGTGFIFLENMFAQHLAHKTVLSILAWVFFAVVLGGRILYGWRGEVAIRWTLGGFLSLMLAYFGSKMVLEWILHRS
ncbi:MAG: cytochrome C assembly family protein [Methylococcaceae bacterium]